MIPNTEHLFETIAESIQSAIAEAWSNATIDAVFYPDGCRYTGKYIRESDGESISFSTGSAGQRAFRELRRQFKDAGKPLWGKACFELNCDGQFRMEWHYDDCDENGFAKFDASADFTNFEDMLDRLAEP